MLASDPAYCKCNVPQRCKKVFNLQRKTPKNFRGLIFIPQIQHL